MEATLWYLQDGALPLRCNPAGERSERCPGGAFAVRRKRGERVNRGKQRIEAPAIPAAPTEIAECKPEKNRNHRKNKKPGSVGKSTLPGVEVGEALTTASGGNLVRAEVKL